MPVPYFHVVFTLPQQIGRLALQNAKPIFNLLFHAASRALLETAADPRLLGASIGFLAVLHTWGQNLHLHPHLHCVVPGGGISPDGSRWIACRKSSFFLPMRVLSRPFRKIFLQSLRAAFRKGVLRFHGELHSLANPAPFQLLCQQTEAIEWVVHVKPPFGRPERVLKYLARYTHRVAISNHRLRSLQDGRVTFEWKDYADRSRTKTMTLEALSSSAASSFMCCPPVWSASVSSDSWPIESDNTSWNSAASCSPSANLVLSSALISVSISISPTRMPAPFVNRGG